MDSLLDAEAKGNKPHHIENDVEYVGVEKAWREKPPDLSFTNPFTHQLGLNCRWGNLLSSGKSFNRSGIDPSPVRCGENLFPKGLPSWAQWIGGIQALYPIGSNQSQFKFMRFGIIKQECSDYGGGNSDRNTSSKLRRLPEVF
jgi:hypothetical protein